MEENISTPNPEIIYYLEDEAETKFKGETQNFEVSKLSFDDEDFEDVATMTNPELEQETAITETVTATKTKVKAKTAHIPVSTKISFDSEERRYIDRIRAVAFREARDAGAKFIKKKWIAQRLHRSIEFVKHNWSKSYAECKTTFGGGRPQKLSQESVALVKELSKGSKRKSTVLIAKELETRTNEKISRTTVMRYQKKIIPKSDVSKTPKVKAPRKSRSKKKPVEETITIDPGTGTGAVENTHIVNVHTETPTEPIHVNVNPDTYCEVTVSQIHPDLPLIFTTTDPIAAAKILNGSGYAEIQQQLQQSVLHHQGSQNFYLTDQLNYSTEAPTS